MREDTLLLKLRVRREYLQKMVSIYERDARGYCNRDGIVKCVKSEIAFLNDVIPDDEDEDEEPRG